MPSDKDIKRAAGIEQALATYATAPLPGVGMAAARKALSLQIVDSLRRVEYAHYIRDAKHDASRADPSSDNFDPFRAAVLFNRQGNLDEAYWLTFLGTHFGKHAIDRWRLCRDVYGRLKVGPIITWAAIRDDFAEIAAWLPVGVATMRADGVSRRFSNHRKYESLDQIEQVFSSYRDWVLGYGGHGAMIQALHQKLGQNPHDVFDALYTGMDNVQRFGRLAKFDFLTMLGKLGISPIEPGTPYCAGATGPLRGARLLFTGQVTGLMSAKAADAQLLELGQTLGAGMQVMEDSICNWQKSPNLFIRFRG